MGIVVLALNSYSQEAAGITTKLAVTAIAGKPKSDVVINPNPVQGATFTLELQNLEKGKYNIYMFDDTGKKYLVKVLNTEGGSLTETLPLPQKADKGIYILQVVSKTVRVSKKMIVE